MTDALVSADPTTARHTPEIARRLERAVRPAVEWLDVRCRPALRCVPATNAPSLRSLLAPLALEVEADQDARAWVRSHARATLVAHVARRQAAHAALSDAPWLVSLGGRFFWWGYAAEGVAYWEGVRALLDRHREATRERRRVVAGSIAALRILSGEVPRADVAVLGIERALGADHPMVLAVKAARPVPCPAHDCDAWVAPRVIELAPAARRALWLTLAFLRCLIEGGADASNPRDDYAGALRRLELPDVWLRLGSKRLLQMLREAMLEELSAELGAAPAATRHDLVAALWDLVVVSGLREVEVVERIGGWLGVVAEYD